MIAGLLRESGTGILLVSAEELRHLPATHDRQIPTKQHAIETGKHTMNPIVVLLDEFFHCFNPPAAVKGRDQL